MGEFTDLRETATVVGWLLDWARDWLIDALQGSPWTRCSFDERHRRRMQSPQGEAAARPGCG